MSSIIREGDTYHGISVFGRGLFTNDGHTFAGQYRDGYACGLGVLTHSSGSKGYAEHGPDGRVDVRCLGRTAHGDTRYCLFERGEPKEDAVVFADGSCTYDGEACAPDDLRLLALIAHVAPVEVRPAAPARHTPLAPPLAPKPSSDGSAGSFCPRRHWRRPRPPRCTPTPHAVAGGSDTTQQQPHAKHVRAATCARDRFAVEVAREAPSCTLTTAAWCTPMGPSGSSAAMPLP
jgi:hypothetical protein